jgi:type III restriction enzyme
MIEDLIAHITPPIKLTRKTWSAIVLRTTNRKSALDNPQEFALHAARIIRKKAIEQLVAGIQYSKDGTWYDMSEWIEEEETISDRLVPVSNSIYDHIVVHSETEKRFVEKLKRRSDVRLVVKLPGWFKVTTPVGQYNPDWGLVRKRWTRLAIAGHCCISFVKRKALPSQVS